MFFTFSKLFSFVTSPVFWIILFIIGFLIFMKRKQGKFFLASAIALFMVFTNINVYNFVSNWWEGHKQNPNSVTVHYDGIIVLGGGVAGYNNEKHFKFSSSSDRLFKAIELFKEGKADNLIFSGGSVGKVKEGQIVKNYLKTINISEDSTLIEWHSLNTYENAVETSKLLDSAGISNGNFLLVTSGYHIKRSMDCFKKQGINVTPFATDFIPEINTTNYAGIWYPSTSVINKWRPILKEWIGYTAYLFVGYI